MLLLLKGQGHSPLMARGLVFSFYGASSTEAATDSAQHSVQSFINSTASFMTVDGVDGSPGGGVGTNALGTSTLRLCVDGSGNFMTGNFFEQGIWAATFTGTQRTNISNNATGYW
jgi:hypothetical protein